MMWKMLKKLLPSKHFLKGMGSVFDLSGSCYSEDIQRILNRTDAEAIASDWESVGNSFRKVLRNLK